jgi:hypothetical protein
LRHLDFLNISIDENWEPHRNVQLSINPNIKLWAVIESLPHHGHDNDLRRTAIRVVSHRRALDGEILIVCVVLKLYLDVLRVLAIFASEGKHHALKVLDLLNAA